MWLCIRLNNVGKWACNRLTENADFDKKKKIIFSYEAHFDLGGYVNKQHCRIGPFFFENQQGEAVTVNGHRYRAMLNEFLFTKLEEKNMGNIWFQQNDATCHTAETTLEVLCPVLEDRIISRRANVVWPPRSEMFCNPN